MKLLLSIAFTSLGPFPFMANAQGTVVVVIDTLITGMDNFQLFQGDGRKAEHFEGTGRYRKDTIPQFIATAQVEQGGQLRLPLTTKEGSLNIHLPKDRWIDTLHVRSFRTLPTCSWDSSETIASWYRMDRIDGPPVKHERTVSAAPPPSCASTRIRIELLVNDQVHIVPIVPRRQNDVLVTDFHGYKPRDCQTKTPTDKGYRRCRILQGRSWQWRWTLVGDLYVE